MRHPGALSTALFAAAFTVGALTACSRALRPGAEANNARFERQVGTGSAEDLITISGRVIRLHRYEIVKQEGAPRVYIETQWLDRHPFDDEQMLGVTRAQTRLLLRGTAHGSTPLGPLYRLDLTVETRVQLAEPGQWTETMATDDYRKYADRITEDLKRELTVGVRRWDGR
jgi:hypothetical protein